MKALSLWQPHAAAIALGLKPYETRSWSTGYRGQLAIHAAKRPWNDAGDPAVCAWHDEAERRISARCCDLVLDRFPELVEKERLKVVANKLLDSVLVFGAVICVVNLAEDIPTNQLRGLIPEEHEFWGDFSEGRHAFRLLNMRMLAKPLPWRGQQGFFDVDVEMQGESPTATERQLSLFGGE